MLFELYQILSFGATAKGREDLFQALPAAFLLRRLDLPLRRHGLDDLTLTATLGFPAD